MADIEYDVWADFILSYTADAGLEIQQVLDLACGTGKLTQQLSAAGLNVTGLDASAEMLKVAAERLPNTAFVQGDLRTFELAQRYELITCVFDSLNNLTEDGDLLLALGQMHQHLAAGGLVVFDVNTRIGVRELWDGDQIEGVEPLEGGSEVHFQWTHRYDPASDLGIVQAYCRIVEAVESGAEYQELDHQEFVETHQERGYDPAELSTALKSAGFERWEILEYPDYALPEDDSPRVWVFAWKAEA